MSLAQPGDTRWESHLLTINRVVSMFNAIINVLENISKDGINSKQRLIATRHMSTMQDFELVFCFNGSIIECIAIVLEVGCASL